MDPSGFKRTVVTCPQTRELSQGLETGHFKVISKLWAQAWPCW